MRSSWWRIGVLLAAVGACSFVLAADVPVNAPFDLQAPSIRMEEGIIIASGGVTGRFDNVFVRADSLSADRASGDLHLEGNIYFDRDGAVWEGNELDYNFLTHKGLFGTSAMQYGAFKISAEKMERVSTNEFVLSDAQVTTCPKECPHFSAHLHEGRLIDENLIKGKGLTLYFGKIPWFYFPYWRYQLGERMVTFDFGYNERWGASMLTDVRIPISKYVDSVSEIDLRSARGVGLGQGFEWDHPDVQGGITAYHLKDWDPNRRFDSTEIKEDRYRAKFEHLQRFEPDHYINTRMNYLSDPYVLNEYFEREHHQATQPENYAAWIVGNPGFATEAFVSQRLNDYYQNINRYDASLDLYRKKVGSFYIQNNSSISYLERVDSSTNLVTLPSHDTVRFDSSSTVYMPHRVGFLRMVPRAGYRATYYSDTRVPSPPGKNNDALRHLYGAGMELSFQASRILSDRERWYGKGLRHKVEPYTDYQFAESTIDSSTLYHFDDVDLLDDTSRQKVGLRNILQTKRDGRLERFIDLDLYTYYQYEGYTQNEPFEDLFIDARMPLTSRLFLDLEGQYDWYAKELSFFDSRLSYNHDDVIFSVEHLYWSNDRSLWTPRIQLFPTRKITFEAYARYEDRYKEWEEFGFFNYFTYCCMRYGVGYRNYDDEHIIQFSIALSAFPEARISSGGF